MVLRFTCIPVSHCVPSVLSSLSLPSSLGPLSFLFLQPNKLNEPNKPSSLIDELVKSHQSDDTVKSSRCKARESLRMRRTYWYAGLAERSQAMTKDEAQRSRWTFYEVVLI